MEQYTSGPSNNTPTNTCVVAQHETSSPQQLPEQYSLWLILEEIVGVRAFLRKLNNQINSQITLMKAHTCNNHLLLVYFEGLVLVKASSGIPQHKNAQQNSTNKSLFKTRA